MDFQRLREEFVKAKEGDDALPDRKVTTTLSIVFAWLLLQRLSPDVVDGLPEVLRQFAGQGNALFFSHNKVGVYLPPGIDELDIIKAIQETWVLRAAVDANEALGQALGHLRRNMQR